MLPFPESGGGGRAPDGHSLAMSGSEEWTVRALEYRSAPESDLAAIHLVETEVDAERRPDRPAQPFDTYVGYARDLPASLAVWTWLVEGRDGTPLATGAAWHREGADAGVLHADIWVRALWRGRGIGTALLRRIVDVAVDQGRSRLVAATTDAAPSGERFARRAGGRVARVNRTSALDLDAVDWGLVSQWASDGPRRAPGYTLDLVVGPYPRHLYADAVTLHDIMETAPRDDLDTGSWDMTEEQVAEIDRWLVASGTTRWVLFVRDRSGACVGGTSIHLEPGDPTMVSQQDTGIHPDHRGRGLAKWAKAAMLLKIRAELPEARRVRTGNAYSNAAMLAINDALGFTVTLTQTEWQAEVTAVAAMAGGSASTMVADPQA